MLKYSDSLYEKPATLTDWITMQVVLTLESLRES